MVCEVKTPVGEDTEWLISPPKLAARENDALTTENSCGGGGSLKQVNIELGYKTQ